MNRIERINQVACRAAEMGDQGADLRDYCALLAADLIREYPDIFEGHTALHVYGELLALVQTKRSETFKSPNQGAQP